MIDFDTAFQALTGNSPFPWQTALHKLFEQGEIPASCNLPTGLGKTSVIAVWLIALANHPDKLPRRLVYVVNRRTVVDQTTDEVEKYCDRLADCSSLLDSLRVMGRDEFAIPFRPQPLALSTLRGQFADNREWSADPSRPAVICGTVDMIGSRLLFSGYGVGMKGKPLHAGFLGQDSLIVHDEAHLEPAFQTLLENIRDEQDRCKDFRPLRVMELTATRRGTGDVFELTKGEREIPANWENRPKEPIRYVWQRLKSKKALALQSAKRDVVAKTIGETARSKWAKSEKAVLVFVRTIDDVKTVYAALTDKKHGGAEADHVQLLTGTLRGLERDRMANPREETGCPVFARFLPKPKDDAPDAEKWKVVPKPGTVFLVCTSAGEVGVDISADHMVCDLTTLDSMAQRFGRVNRRGEGDAQIDVVYETDRDPKKKDDGFEQARWKTKEVLERLPKGDRHDASPFALRELMGKLPEAERDAAFAPTPVILPATDILFDAWALTTIRDKLPGRPPVEPYLHGLPTSWQPPETHVAWREEVEKITGDLLAEYEPTELLEAYPLKPHELLKDNSRRVFDRLKKLLAPPDTPVWLQSDDGAVQPTTLGDVISGDADDLNYLTVLLPPSAGGLTAGMLDGTAEGRPELDVADEWFSDKEKTKRVRIRVWDEASVPEEMHLLETIDTKPEVDESDEASTGRRFWRWFARGNEGDKSAKNPVLWEVHIKDVVEKAKEIVANLPLDDELKRAIITAAEFHDHGKKRKLFQRVLGNTNPNRWLAKSGKKGGRVKEQYRHEFGSLLDVDELPGEHRDLILHLIAAHHGRARPHFPPDEAFDPERSHDTAQKMAAEVPQRFARLQRKYGRWGLAYLESLLRAADWAASAKPSKEENE